MKTNKILKKVAQKNCVSIMEVKREIQAALDEGMRSSDPKVLDYWKSIPCKGEKPTIDEVITYLTKKSYL